MRRLTVPNNPLFDEVSRLLDEGRQVTIRTKGRSMLPFIRGGRDSVLLLSQKDYQAGDIVLFKTGGRYILHRILQVKGDQVTLMGDGNLYGKEHCLKTEICGKAVRIIHPDGSVVYCDSRVQRGKAWMWQKLRPVRRYLLFFYRLVYKIN